MPLESRKEVPSDMPVSLSDSWKRLSGSAVPSTYPPGVHLVHQGTEAAEIYFIRRGLIKLESTDRSGRSTIVGLRRSGNVIGAEAAIVGKPSLTSVVTVTECILERLPAIQFRSRIRQDSQLLWQMVQLSATELRETMAALVEMKSHSAHVRLRRLVRELGIELGQGSAQNVEVCLPLRYWELAQMLGITPEHLSRLLKRLEEEGFLDRKKSFLIVRRPQARLR